MINVVANRAFGVTDPVIVAEHSGQFAVVAEKLEVENCRLSLAGLPPRLFDTLPHFLAGRIQADARLIIGIVTQPDFKLRTGAAKLSHLARAGFM